MSLTLSRVRNRTVVLRPQQLVTINEPVVERIIDDPVNRTVTALVAGIGLIEISSLCGENYDNPEWTNELVVQELGMQLRPVRESAPSAPIEDPVVDPVTDNP